MRCNYCGTEITNDMKFCPVCGNNLGTGTGSGDHGAGTIFGGKGGGFKNPTEDPNIHIKPPSNTGGKDKNKGKKVRTILILIFVAILALGITGTVFYINSSARTIVKQIDKGNYNSVAQIYDRKVKDNFIQNLLLNKLAKKDCQKILENFKTKELSYEDARDRLDAYRSLNSDDLMEFLTDDIATLDSLHESMEAYEKAEKLYKDGNYAEAMAAYSLVVESDENYKDAQTKLSKCVENYKSEILSKTENPDSVEAYEDALEIIKIAVQVVKDDEELSGRLEELEDGYAALLKSEALSNGTQYIKDGKYKELFELLGKALETNTNDTELENLQKTAEGEYVKMVQAKVDEYLKDDKYDEAIKYLQGTTDVLKSNTTLSDLLTKVQGNVPIQLCNLKISESDRFEAGVNLSVIEDSIGNVYSSENLYKLTPHYSDIPAYATYYLNGEFSKIKGIIAVADDSKLQKMGKISILDENGKLLYTSGDMSKTTAPKKIEVDVSGVKWITISAINSGKLSDGFKAFIADWVLYKD